MRLLPPCILLLYPHSLHSTGLPKGVLSTQRMFLTNVLNVRVCISGMAVVLNARADFRGDKASCSAPRRRYPRPPKRPTQGRPRLRPPIPRDRLNKSNGTHQAHLPVPFIHSYAHQMLATLNGLKVVLMRKWVPEEGAVLYTSSIPSR